MPAEHPTPQDVAGLLSNTLPVDEAAGIYQHFDTCESCRTKFPQVVAASESADPDSDSEVRYQQFRQQLLVAGPSPRQDPSAARPSPAPSIPGYDFVRVIGRGGMGVVYEAIETATGRRVAVKVVSGSSPALSTLFQQEVRTHARMQHPNLVRFLSAGEADGRPYLVMEYVDGGTLAERVKESPLSPRLAVRLTEVIARAVGDAHRLGFVHRDLKPANVLLDHGDRESGVLWDDKPKEQEQEHEKPKEKSKVKKKEYVQVKASDFGLAHELSDTGSGGTPAYMSPEQTNGNKTTPATDVWALGVMLYELLTGGRPFSGTKEELFTGIQKGKYPPPKHRGKKLSADLTAVIAKCLLLNPQDRYANARELADELRRLLDTRPVLARPVGRFRRAALWGKRNPIGALLAGVVAVAFIGSLAFSYYLSEARDQAKTAAGVAQSEKTIADQQRDRANRRFNQVRELANKFISFDDPLRALAGSTPARKRRGTRPICSTRLPSRT
jgi:serine/threonine protein kinase